MRNENLYRLAELGLQTIADHHDINLALNFLGSIANQKDMPEAYRDGILKYTRQIRLGLDRLSKIQHQKEGIESDFSVLDVAKNIKKFFNRELPEMEIDCESDIILHTKKVIILQSLINLVDNACLFAASKYSFPDGKCRITIANSSITISDNGTGVPDEIKNQIFDKYFTTRDTNKNSSITGTGLYIAKDLLNSIGCELTVENNTILSGANFKITFPKSIINNNHGN